RARPAHAAARAVLTIVVLAGLAACDKNDRFGGSFRGLAIGTKAPSLATKTLADVGGDLSKITTYRQPDPRMYQFSVDKALAQGKPILLEFATPGHCTPCDEQLQVAKALLEKYQDRVIFIHVDQYQNPQAYKAYRVMGDPWTFAIDKDGVVRVQRPGKMLYEEMEIAIQKILPADSSSARPQRVS
ncbi:MAG TPA: thioredoxin family protein, partial [Burkholderiaceae bacterium]|nr:thioredoxin family protein [Burkholderiaceae bacterium]